MHREFVPLLRPNGEGIDYGSLEHFVVPVPAKDGAVAAKEDDGDDYDDDDDDDYNATGKIRIL